MNKLYDEAIKKLNDDERALSHLQCSLLTLAYREVHRPGVLIATNKRVFFYAIDEGLEYTESFLYNDISSIEEKEGILKEHIVMHVGGEVIKITNVNILNDNLDEFLNIVKDNIDKIKINKNI